MNFITEAFYTRNIRNRVGDCWETLTELQVAGFQGLKGTARRHSYKIKYGNIRQCEQLRNTCNNLKCINPDHLEIKPSRAYSRKSKVDSVLSSL